MTPRNTDKPLIPYLRQSKKKEQTISIDDQRRAIEKWAESNDVKLAQPIIEQNVSGSKPWRERELGEAMEAVERGEAQGIIVAFQDRLSRENGRATAEVWEALEKAQARLVCAAEGLDTKTGDHEMLFTIKAAIAREQWKRHRLNWQNARRDAVERGVHVGAVPVGYFRETTTDKHGNTILDPNGTLKEHPVYGAVVREAFKLRANGARWADVVRLFNDNHLPTRSGKPWVTQGVKNVLSNEVYRGVVKHGEFRYEGQAHTPLVNAGTWHQAQGQQNGEKAAPVSGESILRTIAKCGTCGAPMVKNNSPRKSGANYPSLICSNRRDCPARASISRKLIENYVVEAALRDGVLTFSGSSRSGGEGSGEAYDAAIARLEEAEGALAEFDAEWTKSGLPMAEAIGMKRSLIEERDAAVAALQALPNAEGPGWALNDIGAFVIGHAIMRGATQDYLDRASEAVAMVERGTASEEHQTFVLALLAHAAPEEVQRLLKTKYEKVVVAPGRMPVEKKVQLVPREPS